MEKDCSSQSVLANCGEYNGRLEAANVAELSDLRGAWCEAVGSVFEDETINANQNPAMSSQRRKSNNEKN